MCYNVNITSPTSAILQEGFKKDVDSSEQNKDFVSGYHKFAEVC